MIETSFSLEDIISALIGGALIGASASLLLRLNGRIAGVSGILAGMFDLRSPESSWQRLFIGGLLFGGVLLAGLRPGALASDAPRSLVVTVLAGVLVGVGTRMAGGCTSGHGVCGISRLSRRSMAATAMFMTAGAVTVFLMRHIGPW